MAFYVEVFSAFFAQLRALRNKESFAGILPGFSDLRLTEAERTRSRGFKAYLRRKIYRRGTSPWGEPLATPNPFRYRLQARGKSG